MRNLFLTIWNVVDPVYYFLSRLEHIDPQNGTFRVRMMKYKGQDVMLSDGTFITKNDTLLKIHLHNIKILGELKSVSNSVKRGRIIFRRVYLSMPSLAKYVQNHQHHHEIKGIIGITVLYKGAEKLGFEIIQPNNRVYRGFKRLTQLPICLLSKEHSSLRKVPDTYYLFISKEKLLKTYQ